MTLAHLSIPLWRSLGGGVLIGAGASALILANGRFAGISGILDRLLHGVAGPGHWRIGFVVGLLIPGLILGSGNPVYVSGPWTLLASGLLVGFGTRTGSGCTSGHGVCGMANLSPRSAVATLTFIVVGVATAYGMKHLPLP